MAVSPFLDDFLARTKKTGSGEQSKTKAGLLPPTVSPELFSAISGRNTQTNYGNLNRIGQRIQQARANSDADYAAKQAKKQQEKLLKMIKDLQADVAASKAASIPTSFGGGGSSIGTNYVPSTGGGGSSSLPVIPPRSSGGNIKFPDAVPPPVVAPRICYIHVMGVKLPVPC